MRIIVSSQGEGLDALASPVFGRCPTFLLIDTETMEYEAVSNPAMSQGGGAGIQAAQFVVNQGVEAVLSGNLGPNAFDVLQAAGVPGYLISEGTVRQAVEAFKAGQLQPMGGANVAAHAGMPGRAAHAGMSGRGRSTGGRSSQPTVPPPVQQTQSGNEAELADLRDTLKNLRQQLAETMQRIEELERK
jgi:predicted Fe-Mo cluster-binding NifX family protein